MVFGNDKKIMKNHLRDYILFQINQGYEANDIKNLLQGYGYSQELIDEIFSEIGTLPHRKPAKKHKKEISADLFSYVKELIVDFIIKEKEQGYSIDAIKRALMNYGHSKELVDSAVAAVDGSDSGKDYDFFKEDAVKKSSQLEDTDPLMNLKGKGLPPFLLYVLSLLLVFGFVVFMSAVTNTFFSIVFFSFTPVMIALTVNFLAVMQFKSRNYLNLVPFLVVFLTVFIFVGILHSDFLLEEVAQPEIVVLLNSVIAFVFSSVMCFFSKWPHMGEKPDKWETIPVREVQPETAIEREIEEGDKKLEKLLGKDD